MQNAVEKVHAKMPCKTAVEKVHAKMPCKNVM
jgi:hypothetical protein